MKFKQLLNNNKANKIELKKWQENLLIGVATIVLGLIASGLLFLATGKNPITAYYYLYEGATRSIDRFGNALGMASILTLTGLAAAFSFKTGLFNIGISGQMMLGGFGAIYVTLALRLPTPISQILAILVAMTVGALWAMIPGILKAVVNVNEVVSTIMMNWIAYWLVSYGVVLPVVKGSYTTETAAVSEAMSLRIAWLRKMFNGSNISGGIFLAIIAVIVIWFILEKTTLGYELKAVGSNRHAARYAGMNVNRNFVLAMMISGGLAGIAGVVYYMGYSLNLQAGSLPKMGMDGIAIALLGSNSPIGVSLVAIFFGMLETGKGFMSSMTNTPKEVTDVIIATIIYFAATSILVRNFYLKIMSRNEKGPERGQE